MSLTQAIHVTFDKLDCAAKEMAGTIGDLVQGRDLNNLVIMCGEYHETLSHHFYGVQLVKYLKQGKIVSDYCAEFPSSLQMRLDIYDKKDKMTLGNVHQRAAQLAYKMQYPDRAMLPVAFAQARHIPVHFMDMPFRIADNGDGKVFPMDGEIGERMAQNPGIKRMAARNVSFEQGFPQTSGRGMTCRDLYMTEQVNAVLQDGRRGGVYTQTGLAHMVDKKRKTLANYLLDTGRDIVMVGMQGPTAPVDYTHMLEHAVNTGQGSVLGFFKVALPSNTRAQQRAPLEKSWSELLRANKVACPSLR